MMMMMMMTTTTTIAIVMMIMIMMALNPMPCKYMSSYQKNRFRISPALNGIPLDGLQRQALAKTGEISVANCYDSDHWLNLSSAHGAPKLQRTSQDGDA